MTGAPLSHDKQCALQDSRSTNLRSFALHYDAVAAGGSGGKVRPCMVDRGTHTIRYSMRRECFRYPRGARLPLHTSSRTMYIHTHSTLSIGPVGQAVNPCLDYRTTLAPQLLNSSTPQLLVPKPWDPLTPTAAKPSYATYQASN